MRLVIFFRFCFQLKIHELKCYRVNETERHRTFKSDFHAMSFNSWIFNWVVIHSFPCPTTVRASPFHQQHHRRRRLVVFIYSLNLHYKEFHDRWQRQV